MRKTAPIGKELRRIRREKDITQHLLAKKSGVPQSYISKYEKDNAAPSLNAIIKISKILQISLDALLLGNAPININKIKDSELLAKFQAIQNIPEEQKALIKTYLDGFLARKSA